MRCLRAWRLAIAALPLAVVLALGPGATRSRSAGPPGVPAGAVRGESASRLRGSGSCSGTSCHGSIASVPGASVLRNEHTTWISEDPHSRAYQVLLQPRSQQMVRKLAAGASSWTPAHEDARCLACHATPRRPAELAATSWMNEDGVGCESCHGAAAGWYGEHTEVRWKGLGADQKASVGFLNTKDLADRALTCAGCHVGRRDDPEGTIDRDVNHDLIAAGHPRLNFEFAAYLAMEPPHWVEKGPNATADFPARAWAVGQAASASASARLLKGRASNPTAPWPELSESSCFACHHSLTDQAWRQDRGETGGTPGLTSWGSWFLPMTRALSAELGNPSIDEVYTPLIDTMSRPLPDRATAAAQAGKVAAALDAWLPSLLSSQLDKATIERLLQSWDSPDGWRSVRGWDQAAQRYLALVPLRQAAERLGAGANLVPRSRLDALLKALAFPPGDDGPGSQFNPARLPEE